MSENTLPTPCQPSGSCQLYAPGHHLHVIHAGRLGMTPWGWRDGVVTAASSDGWVEVDYVGEDGQVRAWHHEDLTGELAVGSLVRVHEQYYALSAPFGWLNLHLTGGLGPVPQPADLEPFRGQFSTGVVDLATGRGVAIDQVPPGDADG
jgi:hypothetical protein